MTKPDIHITSYPRIKESNSSNKQNTIMIYSNTVPIPNRNIMKAVKIDNYFNYYSINILTNLSLNLLLLSKHSPQKNQRVSVDFLYYTFISSLNFASAFFSRRLTVICEMFSSFARATCVFCSKYLPSIICFSTSDNLSKVFLIKS